MIDTRDRVFSRLTADFLVRGRTRVSWSLYRDFLDPPPYSFQLQVGSTGSPEADDWSYLGPPAVNSYFALDPVRRAYGMGRRTWYRVTLTTPVGSYLSRPVSTTGEHLKHDWLIAREILRANRLLMDRATALPGWLLKRRWSGAAPDPRDLAKAVTDPLSGAVINTRSPVNQGTAFYRGYFDPQPFLVEKDPAQSRDTLDDRRGSVDDPRVSVGGRTVLVPDLGTEDVFVADGSDVRYFIQHKGDAAEWRGVPILARVELRPAPASDPIYDLLMPDDLSERQHAEFSALFGVPFRRKSPPRSGVHPDFDPMLGIPFRDQVPTSSD